ncbi:hypothetical protein AYI70_g10533 [Smittium culicis]|uniref:PH domain-containing protein n=1 Tax=Smittium culicis TaxID=133412 RepID=A0A1R1X636_9FUNG|nr:hypothetical protein AYI70_g10533 [Smittium culicis]
MSRIRKILSPSKKNKENRLSTFRKTGLPPAPELSYNLINKDVETTIQVDFPTNPNNDSLPSISQSIISSRKSDDYSSILNSYIGTGDESDLLVIRLNNIHEYLSSYIEYFKAMLKVQKTLENIKINAGNLPHAQFNTDHIFMPSGSNGIQDLNNDFSAIISKTINDQNTKKNAILIKTIASLTNINSDISSFSNTYKDKIYPIYKTLISERKQIDKLNRSLIVALESAKIPNVSKQPQDPFLINFELKKVISKVIETEKSFYNAVHQEIEKFKNWEPFIIHRIYSAILEYFYSEKISSNELHLKYSELCHNLQSSNSLLETQEFLSKFGKYLVSPQNSEKLPLKDKYSSIYQNDKSLRVIKKGYLVRKSKGISNLISLNKKFVRCFVIVSASGFLHCFDDSHTMPTSQPDVSLHLASAVVKDGDNLNLPRNTILIYVTRGSVKGNPISSKTKVCFKAESYSEGIEWSHCIKNWSKSSIEDIFSEELKDVNNADEDNEDDEHESNHLLSSQKYNPFEVDFHQFNSTEANPLKIGPDDDKESNTFDSASAIIPHTSSTQSHNSQKLDRHKSFQVQSSSGDSSLTNNHMKSHMSMVPIQYPNNFNPLMPVPFNPNNTYAPILYPPFNFNVDQTNDQPIPYYQMINTNQPISYPNLPQNNNLPNPPLPGQTSIPTIDSTVNPTLNAGNPQINTLQQIDTFNTPVNSNAITPSANEAISKENFQISPSNNSQNLSAISSGVQNLNIGTPTDTQDINIDTSLRILQPTQNDTISPTLKPIVPPILNTTVPSIQSSTDLPPQNLTDPSSQSPTSSESQKYANSANQNSSYNFETGFDIAYSQFYANNNFSQSSLSNEKNQLLSQKLDTVNIESNDSPAQLNAQCIDSNNNDTTDKLIDSNSPKRISNNKDDDINKSVVSQDSSPKKSTASKSVKSKITFAESDTKYVYSDVASSSSLDSLSSHSDRSDTSDKPELSDSNPQGLGNMLNANNDEKIELISNLPTESKSNLSASPIHTTTGLSPETPFSNPLTSSPNTAQFQTQQLQLSSAPENSAFNQGSLDSEYLKENSIDGNYQLPNLSTDLQQAHNPTSESENIKTADNGEDFSKLFKDLDSSILPPGISFGKPITSLPPGAKIFKL